MVAPDISGTYCRVAIALGRAGLGGQVGELSLSHMIAGVSLPQVLLISLLLQERTFVPSGSYIGRREALAG
jgi:hypothetical protein